MLKANVSVRAVVGLSKEERLSLVSFTNYRETLFKDLVYLLKKDYIYSAFNFLGYIRGNKNICSTANIIILDVDDTSIHIKDRLNELQEEGLICILGTTSDNTNMYKYRIVIPLNREVTSYEYVLLVRGIKLNGLVTDFDVGASVKAGGFFFSYFNSLVIHNFNGSTLVVDDYIADPQQPEHRALDPTADVSDILHEFNSYGTAIKGGRTKCLLHAAYRCLDYGLTDNQLEKVINYVNSTFLIPKDTHSIQRRVLQFIKSQRKHK